MLKSKIIQNKIFRQNEKNNIIKTKEKSLIDI